MSRWHHVGIEVENLLYSKAFYTEMLGFECVKERYYKGEHLVFLQKEGLMIELVKTHNDQSKSSSVHFAIEVDSIEEWRLFFQDSGMVPLEEPNQLEDFHSIFYHGPSGEQIELVEKVNDY
ncbi:VOC family protein [Halobacillus salinarum]|uniref:VOC family protein n=1 Tax=Halobacillus salinarum TaxID=2932257 RepID=A0ABY4EMH5_9BACI|nr:VOC family protein [Halobacillus salinarum]UOQ45200.1 VOC family protein [Halobacillus salinarum]